MSVITGTGRRVRGRVKEESELFPLTITEAQRKHHPDGIAVSSVNHRNAEEAACRRHGRLVAGILATFAVDPDAALTVADIAMLAYGVELPEVTKAHRVAVLRAMRRVCELEPRFGLVDGDGPLGQAIIYDRTRALSYGLARLKADYLYHYQWSRVPRGEGSEPEGEAALRARLAPGGDHHHEYVTPGGGWWRHARKALAELEGDQETLSKLSAEHQAEWAAMMAFASEAGFVRDPRPAPPPLPEVPTASWRDVKAWSDALDRAVWRKDQRYILVKWIKAAGGVAHKWSIDLPHEVWGTRVYGIIEAYAERCSFTRGMCIMDAASVSSVRSKSQRKHQGGRGARRGCAGGA